ncbi:MAG: 4'-phosphopantetheinyl transferase superfamily protein [Desulfobacterales bacterium]|nr:4'-phosphopantetheinyl transferase superfamily protein [Desulfobacterales bacterium]
MEHNDPSKTIYPVILEVPESKLRLQGRQKVRFLSEFARVALKSSAMRLGVVLPELEKTENGAPMPRGGIHWSLSHKSGCVAAVAAPAPVGIDIEKIRPVKEGLAERIAAPDEWRLFPGEGLSDFFRCWTAKEAVLKAAGVGIAGLSECRIVSVQGRERLSVAFESIFWAVRFHSFGGHLAAVAVNGLGVCWIGEHGCPAS